MIVKGSARAEPMQLATYLLRSDEYAQIIELQDGSHDLHKALMAWHTVGEATRGEKTLYHAQISPETKYKMTPEQFKRGAQILAEDLGMAHHPRVVIIHQGKDRPHAHVVFQRADPETMKMWDDSFNYVKHERASKRMALEFGHDLVPGKHAKRDRKKQAEFPRQQYSQDEAQYEKRTGLSKEERVRQITALHAAADNGPAFKAALEEAGYILANGKRGYVVVDQMGGQSVLSRNTGLKAKQIEAFMAGVELDKLPSVKEAKAMQAERRKTVSKSDAAEAMVNDAEPSKSLDGRTKERKPPDPIDPERKQQISTLRAWSDGAHAFKRALEEAGYTLAQGTTGYVLFSEDGVFNLARHAGMGKFKFEVFMSPIPLDSLPDVETLIEARKQARLESNFITVEQPPPPLVTKDIDLGTRMEISALDMAAQAIAEAQARQKSEIETIEEAIRKRYAEEAGKLRELHERDLRVEEVALDREIAIKLANYKNIEEDQKKAFLDARKERRTGIWGIIDAIENRWNPALGAAKAVARNLERENFYRRLAKERADYEVLLHQSKQQEIENLIERQRLQLSDLKTSMEGEKERRIREQEDTKRLRAELEEARKQEQELEEELERNENLREGPPPPKLGKS